MHYQDYRTTHVGPESWAKDYDAKLFAPGSFDAELWAHEQRLLDEIVMRHVRRRDSYLDFACGTGRVLAHVEPSSVDALTRFTAPVRMTASQSGRRRPAASRATTSKPARCL